MEYTFLDPWGDLTYPEDPGRSLKDPRGDQVDRELFVSYKPLTYLVERRNSPVKLPYIPYNTVYTIFCGTH